ncbi:SDR family oxidoreductase [Streptomyces sp. NPDC046805]|uniref:SDR family oxidoreductase n=1 Tax=Streptomyces sp. NPDC046805 TaxID=3155134 RepID=UPI0033EFFD86
MPSFIIDVGFEGQVVLIADRCVFGGAQDIGIALADAGLELRQAQGPSTMVAEYGVPGMALYGSSKAAVNLLTKSWAAEYGPRGVRVDTVVVGPTRTEGTAPMGENLDGLAAQAPAGRPASPQEIAASIVY